ncbi:MAG: hypothetical protein KDD48_03415 [Bdellovibrionales bacterium]|nr:hypothetical protein [Bdellovibrionales bacterium]
MKKITTLTILCASVLAFAQSNNDTTDVHGHDMSQRSIQLGAGLVLPYRVDSPSGRSATLFGVSADVYASPYVTFGAQGIIGVEDKGFTKNPIYIAPGFGFYPIPGKTFEPYIRADAPILLNNGNDYGARGGLGLMWNAGIAGLGLKYSFDVAYYFKENATVLDFANISAVFNW